MSNIAILFLIEISLQHEFTVHLLFLSCRDNYAIYVETCFEKFRDRVEKSITFNEPHMFSIEGYYRGSFVPGRCTICAAGNSYTEPYIVSHNVLIYFRKKKTLFIYYLNSTLSYPSKSSSMKEKFRREADKYIQNIHHSVPFHIKKRRVISHILTKAS